MINQMELNCKKVRQKRRFVESEVSVQKVAEITKP